MELGLFVEPQAGGSYARLLELARFAESRGFEAFARSDHYLDGERSAPTTDALASLAGLARETERIELVVLVTPLTFRHPAVIAKTATTIDEMSAGRLALGVGTGWMESEHRVFGIELPDLPERFSRLFETLAYLRAAFSGSEGYRGRHYELAPVEVLPHPTGIRLVVGGQGMRRTPRLAGRFADEYNMFACDRETFERRTEAMRQGAEEVGRDPEVIRLSMAFPLMVAPDEATYRETIARRAAERDLTPEAYEEMLATRNVPHGTPERAAEMLAAVADMGVQRAYLQRYAPLDEVDTELFDRLLRAYRG